MPTKIKNKTINIDHIKRDKFSIAKKGDATNLFPLTVDKKTDAHVMSMEINSEITKIAWDNHN